MNFSLTEVSALFILFLLVFYWWRSSEQHAFALKSARKYCKERGIQLLDQTLSFTRYSRTAASNGRKYFTRTYTFEFCQDGQDRHNGEIVLHGFSVMRVMLETQELEITEY